MDCCSLFSPFVAHACKLGRALTATFCFLGYWILSLLLNCLVCVTINTDDFSKVEENNGTGFERLRSLDDVKEDAKNAVTAIGNDFVDNEFNRVGTWKGKGCEWRRMKLPLWNEATGPSPNECKQGQLESCYAIAAFSALAENGENIKLLYAGSNADSSAHAVCLLKQGAWTFVIVDDHFPFIQDEPAACQSLNLKDSVSVLWPALFEKVWAKEYGGNANNYFGIERGLPYYTVHAFSGQPTSHINVKEYTPEQVWEFLMKAHGDGFVVTAGIDALPLFTSCLPSCNLSCLVSSCLHYCMKYSRSFRLFYHFATHLVTSFKYLLILPFTVGGFNEVVVYFYQKWTTGLVSAHAYSVLEANIVPFLGCGKERLIQIRNPHGTGEWKMTWSDSSCCWTINPGAKNVVGFEGVKDDGKFFMNLENFVAHFSFASATLMRIQDKSTGNILVTHDTPLMQPQRPLMNRKSYKIDIGNSKRVGYRLYHTGDGIVDAVVNVEYHNGEQCSHSGFCKPNALWAIKNFSNGQEIQPNPEINVYNPVATELEYQPYSSLSTSQMKLESGKDNWLCIYRRDGGCANNVVVVTIYSSSLSPCDIDLMLPQQVWY